MPTRLEARVPPRFAQQPEDVSVRGVTRRFGTVTALERLDLSVRAGEVVAIVGPSGCGKSTLLELIAGLQEPDDGIVAGAVSAAYMPQRDGLLPWRDAVGNAALALECQGVAARRRAAARRRCSSASASVSSSPRRPHELSGGMRQRVAFVRTLLSGRPLLLLDEPFGALDSLTRGSMQEWLAGALQAEPRTVVMVTHDVDRGAAAGRSRRDPVAAPRPGRHRAPGRPAAPATAPRAGRRPRVRRVRAPRTGGARTLRPLLRDRAAVARRDRGLARGRQPPTGSTT